MPDKTYFLFAKQFDLFPFFFNMTVVLSLRNPQNRQLIWRDFRLPPNWTEYRLLDG